MRAAICGRSTCLKPSCYVRESPPLHGRCFPCKGHELTWPRKVDRYDIATSSKMERTYQFVDVTRLDRATKRSMRSHVMRGKNAGKNFHRPSKFNLPNRTMQLQQLWTPSSARGLGSVFLSLSLPLDLSPRSLEVLGQCKDCNSRNISRCRR